MLPIFSKAFDQITPEDVQALVEQNWPEGGAVEFKATLPHKGSGDDAWMTGGSMSDYARNKILAEVIAFANAHGGTLFLGIAETQTKPPRAEAITPLPRCAELADRLINQVYGCIEPKLPIISVRGVVTEEKGGGVVILRVPQSRLRPHRLEPTSGCYYRRADRCETMSMRDIQDLTLHLQRGLEVIERRFDKRKQTFEGWFMAGRVTGEYNSAFGIRVTIIPTSADLYVQRVHERPEYCAPFRPEFSARLGGNQVQLLVPCSPTRSRPIVRGTRIEGGRDDLLIYQEVYCDGLVEIALKCLGPRRQQGTRALPPMLHLGRILGVAVNAVVCAHRFRSAAGAPDAELGLELEVRTVHGNMPLVGFDYGNLSYIPMEQLKPDPLILPRVSIGSTNEFQQVFNVILTDIYDAAGYQRSQPDRTLTVDLAEALQETP